eukprot:gene22744-29909_t
MQLCTSSLQRCSVGIKPRSVSLRNVTVCMASKKGFGSTTDAEAEGAKEQEASTPAVGGGVEALESQIRSGKSAARKQGKIIPKVKVESAVVRAVSGDRAPSAAEKYETTAVGVLFFLFANIIIFGLVLAGSGFLHEEYDDFCYGKMLWGSSSCW